MSVSAGGVHVDIGLNSDKFDSGLRRTGTELDRFGSRAKGAAAKVSAAMNVSGRALMAGLVAPLAAAASLRGAQQLIDASTRITNSLKVAGVEGEALDRVYQSLFASAQKNAAPLEALATLYGRVALVQGELGASTEEMLRFTDNVAMALRVAGTDAQSASGALLQLSQAMGSGTVRAEEFNSILEGALPIAQAAAAGLKEAGGSVAKLRQLVVDGKVSSEAFFRAFEAGSSMLETKVAGAETTISQGFVRLQNVLIDLAGKFNTATGTSASFARTLDNIAGSLSKLEGSRLIGWIGNLNNALESSGFLQLDTSLKEIETILGLIESVVGGVVDSFDGLADSTGNAVAAALGFETVADAPSALQIKIGELSSALTTGKLDADGLRTELMKLGASPLNLGIQISQIMDLARAAVAASGAVAAIDGGKPAAPGIALQRDEQTLLRKPSAVVKPVSLKDYELPGKPGKKGSKSDAQTFTDNLADYERRNRLLADELALQASLNPLVNDYGYAIGKWRKEQDLLNDAEKAGLTLDEGLREKIAGIAEGYAGGTAALEKLRETQDLAAQSMAEWLDLGKSMTRGFIDDLIEGKTAAEAFGSVMQQLGSRLIDLGLGAPVGGLFTINLGAAQ